MSPEFLEAADKRAYVQLNSHIRKFLLPHLEILMSSLFLKLILSSFNSLLDRNFLLLFSLFGHNILFYHYFPNLVIISYLGIYLPMFGFTESLNLSVATGMVIQKLFMMAPEMRGQMSDAERLAIR